MNHSSMFVHASGHTAAGLRARSFSCVPVRGPQGSANSRILPHLQKDQPGWRQVGNYTHRHMCIYCCAWVWFIQLFKMVVLNIKMIEITFKLAEIIKPSLTQQVLRSGWYVKKCLSCPFSFPGGTESPTVLRARRWLCTWTVRRWTPWTCSEVTIHGSAPTVSQCSGRVCWTKMCLRWVHEGGVECNKKSKWRYEEKCINKLLMCWNKTVYYSPCLTGRGNGKIYIF